MLAEARLLAGKAFVVEQGSYSPDVDPTSAGTHDGGGTADLDAEALTTTQRTAAVSALRRVGFAAWLRPQNSSWSTHIHAIAIGDTDVHTQAADQVGDLYRGRNGLADHAADNLPAAYRVPFTWWEAYQRGSR